MKPIPVTASCILQVHLLLASLAAAAADDNYLLSCGASSTVATSPSTWDGRTWQSDNKATFSSKFGSTTSVTARGAATSLGIPFLSERIFNSTFTYSFPVSPGPKFIRLLFNPSASTSDAYLTLQSSSGHVLLYNFSAYLSSTTPPHQLFVKKEFYVHVPNSRLLITLSPTPPSSYAFLNGMEVVSVPEELYVGPPSPKNVAAPGTHFDLPPNTTALETAYRVNVGGSELSLAEDADSLYRQWVIDDPYVSDVFKGSPGLYDNHTKIEYKVPKYSAPVQVYQTFRSMGNYTNEIKLTENVTWEFELDVGFFYLLRLHWCEVVVDVNTSNYRVFDVYIDQQKAEDDADVFQWAGGYSPVYRDYVVYVDGGGHDTDARRRILQLAMHPNTQSKHKYYDTLLNGLEILKINGTDGSLNATNPSGPTPTIPIRRPPEKSTSHTVPVIIGVITGSILLVVLLFYILIFQRRKWLKTSVGSSRTTSSKSKQFLSAGKSKTTAASLEGRSSLPTHLCRHFTLAEIRFATSDFNNSLILGHGGFGNVYKGTVENEARPTTVAIKRLNPLSSQGANEFKMEIELLSKLRHINLVSLIGYCDEAGEMILVYEYMSHGTLRDHLYPCTDSHTHLSWNRRLNICLGAARGLNYLHTGIDRMIIHRDVKSTNILLDERWSAKVSDFGLSKLGPAGGELSHVSTAVKGSFGYVDPEYYRRQQLTEKSDVYSFGVVLFEVLCGRAAVNPGLPKEQVNLQIWARKNQMRGTLETIVDPTMNGQIAPECLRKFSELAESCVRDEGAHRPSMADVIRGLELALQLQLESTVKTTDEVTGHAFVDDKNTLVQEFQPINISSPTTDDSVTLLRSSVPGCV